MQRLFIIILLSLPAFLPNISQAYEERWTHEYGNGYTAPTQNAVCTQYTDLKNASVSAATYGPYTFTGVSVISFRQEKCNVLDKFNSSDGISIIRSYRCVAGTGVWQSATTTPPTCYVEPPPPPPPCEAGCTGACGSYYSVNSTAVIAKLCISGCKYLTGDGVSTAFSTGSTTWQVQEKTGETCTSSNEPPTEPAPPSCPECDCIKAGKSYGTVNGTVVCTTLGTAGTAPAIVKSTSTSSSSSTSTDAGGTTSTSGSETQQDTIRVYNGDGTVSTSTAGATTNSDGSTTTSTGSKTQSADDFCAENPTDKACVSKTQCEEKPDSPACKHFCEKYPNSATCADFASFWDEAAALPADGGIINTVKELTFNLVQIDGSNSCPAPVLLNFGGHSVSVSYDWLCEYAESFRPVVIAFAYLAAITIVFGAFRKGDF